MHATRDQKSKYISSFQCRGLQFMGHQICENNLGGIIYSWGRGYK